MRYLLLRKSTHNRKSDVEELVICRSLICKNQSIGVMVEMNNE